MSQANVEIARSIIEAFNTGDWDRLFEQLDPDIEWWDREDDPDATVHRGYEGVRAYLAEVGSAVGLRLQATEFVDSVDWVIVCLRLHGRGVASGAEFEEHEVHAYRFRSAKVVQVREYRTKEQALEAVRRYSSTI